MTELSELLNRADEHYRNARKELDKLENILGRLRAVENKGGR